MEEPVYIKNMRELRKKAHYTQEEVSQKLNIQRQTYSNYENEWRQPPLDIIIRLAELYQVSTDYLLLGSEPDGDSTVTPVEGSLCPDDVSGIAPGCNQSDCARPSAAVHKLLKEFYSLSEEEQTEAWLFIQTQESASPDWIFPEQF